MASVTPPKIEISLETRMCSVGDEIGYFHCWEHYSAPVPASPLVGGAPAGIFSKVYGIVEFHDGVRKVDPEIIYFNDEQTKFLCDLNTGEKEHLKGFKERFLKK